MLGVSGWFGGVKLTEVWRGGIEDHVISLAWSPDDRFVAVAGAAGPVVVLDAGTGSARHQWPGHRGGATTVTWADEGTVASAGQDGRVRVWDATTGAERFALDAGARWVESVAVSPCGTYLASAAGKKVRLWGRDGCLLRDYPDHASTVTDLAWRPGGRELTTAAYGGVTLWTPDRPDAAGRLEWKGSVLRLAWSPDAKFLATGDQDSTVHFWVTATDTDLKMFGYPKKVTQLAWDHTSRFLATGGGHRVTVWDCSGSGPANTRPLVLDAHDAASKVSALAFQRAGPLLASGADDGRVLLWHPGSGRRPLADVRFETAVTQLAWSADDVRLVVGTETGAVAVFRAR
ncbi:WD40 repeat domain-containing protein [Gemmata sp. JC673]|uniref:WD40 repeat domain-containing protein n=1 Tax=Gemmata algarum TaxID=2975278 RepID=A0ABU5F2M7_9BACT|nr:WD40 repeat domain-containing protein [Gemmata algarum]MDY3561072.1 WD40 repeat domain-containing protein [Gemmata algarum]